MKRLVLSILALTAALTLITACSDLGTAPSGDDPAMAPNKTIPAPMSDAQLQALYAESENYTYSTISGEIDVRRGGMICGTPEGWPRNSKFKITVPAGAIRLDSGANPVQTFVIQVPVNVHDSRPAMVFKLEPDGAFEVPVEVTVTYPDWLPETDGVHKYCIFQEASGFGWSDHEYLQDSGANRTYSFRTKHFSRWAMGTAKGGTGGP